MGLPGRIIDFHVHLFPDRLFDAIWDFFKSWYRWNIIYRLYYRECIEFLRSRGVLEFVYSNYAHREGIAADLNRWNLEVLAEFPELRCFAAYHPGEAGAVQMAERLLDHPRVLGIKLHFLVQKFMPDDKRLFPLYDLVMKKNKRILFHIGTGPAPSEFTGLDRFKNVLSRYPELHATVAHLGALEYSGFFELLDHHPNLYLDTSFAFMPHWSQRYDLGPGLLEKYRERILYGSDFPFLDVPWETEIGAIQGLNLSSGFYDAIFFLNAGRLICR